MLSLACVCLKISLINLYKTSEQISPTDLILVSALV